MKQVAELVFAFILVGLVLLGLAVVTGNADQHAAQRGSDFSLGCEQQRAPTSPAF